MRLEIPHNEVIGPEEGRGKGGEQGCRDRRNSRFRPAGSSQRVRSQRTA